MNAGSLEKLEIALAHGDHESASDALITTLEGIDRTYGRIDGLSTSGTRLPIDETGQVERFAGRLAAAIASFVTDPSFTFTDPLFADLIPYHRWINLLFEISAVQSAEHLVSQLVAETGIDDRQRLLRILTVFPVRALADSNLADFTGIDESAVLVAALAFVGNRYCFSREVYDLRERLLEWLPGQLSRVDLKHVNAKKLVEPYMMCSYATTPRKHDIKRGIIDLMRAACLAGGCTEWDGTAPPKRARPEIVVSTEAFGVGHSVFRTHSRSVRALRERFHVVGICFEASISPETRECFDEVLIYPSGPFIPAIKQLTEMVLKRRPDMLLQLGVGMAPHTIALASLRLVPIQVASFAHTATSDSPFVDQMILPSDFVKDSATFVEPLLMVPPEAMPYALRRDGEQASVEARSGPRSWPTDGPVRIALPAAIMKLNPRLFATLQRIKDRVARDVEFHLFPLASVGLAKVALGRALADTDIVVHHELPYADYLRELGQCAFFICPFPYGNVNSVVDCIRLGLPGVCLDGDQPHAHADGSLFRRAGLPEELIVQTLDEYVAAVVRLVDDPEWLTHCRRSAAQADLRSPAFNGDEAQFADAMFALLP